MLNFILQHKIVVVIVGLVVAGLAWYSMTQSSSSANSDASLTTTTVTDTGPDADLVETLLALHAVKLDGSIFTDGGFTSLQDHSTQIVPEPIGRPNPFAPLSVSAAPTASTTKSAQLFTNKTGNTH